MSEGMPVTAVDEYYIRALAKEVSRETVNETFKTLGVKVEDAIEVQKDMAALREIRMLVNDREFQSDMLHVRQWRKAVDGVRSKGIVSAISFLVIGAVGFIYYGFQTRFFGG